MTPREAARATMAKAWAAYNYTTACCIICGAPDHDDFALEQIPGPIGDVMRMLHAVDDALPHIVDSQRA